MQNDKPPYTPTGMPEWFQASPTPVLPTQPQPKYRTRLPVKRIFIVVLTIAVIATIIVGYLVYQSPDKVLSDGFGHLLNAQQLTTSGTITAEDENFKVATTLNTQSAQNSGAVTSANIAFQPKTGTDKGKSYTMALNALSQSGANSYTRISGLSAPVNDFLSLYTSYYGIYGFYNSSDNPASITAANDPSTHQAELNSLVDKLVAQIDGQWIEIPKNSSSLENCQIQAYDSLGNPAVSRELLAQYNKHPFLSLKNKDGKNGNYDYVMNYNSSTAQDFDMATPETQFSKQQSGCGGKQSLVSVESDPLGFGSLQNGSVDISVNQWSHTIQTMHVRGNLTVGLSTVSIDATLNFTYTAKPTLTIPTKSTSIDTIEKNTETIDLSLTKGD